MYRKVMFTNVYPHGRGVGLEGFKRFSLGIAQNVLSAQKVMFTNPHRVGWGSISKKHSPGIEQNFQNCTTLNPMVVWSISSSFDRNCMKCSNLQRKLVFANLSPPCSGVGVKLATNCMTSRFALQSKVY